MNDLVVFLAAAALAHALALWLRLPAIPVLILAGLGLSATPWAPSHDFSFALVEAGVAFLVFNAGIELQPRRFARHLPAVLWVAIGQFVIVGLAGILFARHLGFSDAASIYAGFAISASSTLVVIRHLRSQQSQVVLGSHRHDCHDCYP